MYTPFFVTFDICFRNFLHTLLNRQTFHWNVLINWLLEKRSFNLVYFWENVLFFYQFNRHKASLARQTIYNLCYFTPFDLGACSSVGNSFSGLDEKKECNDCQINYTCCGVGIPFPFLHLLFGWWLLGSGCSRINGFKPCQSFHPSEILVVWHYSTGSICGGCWCIFIYFFTDCGQNHHESNKSSWSLAGFKMFVMIMRV